MPCHYCRGKREGVFHRGKFWCCEECDRVLDEFEQFIRAGVSSPH
jgi:hypothetical protein